MKNKKKFNYISIFSSAGVGCYAFKKNNFQNIATAELLEERMNIQKINNVSNGDGYIVGDLTETLIKERIYNRISKFGGEVDILVATPPCQSMSTLNKKTNGDITKNSLVIESLEIIKEIMPRYFVIENVRTFLNSFCLNKKAEYKKIGNEIDDFLGKEYLIKKQTINFKDYGTNSSRPRTLVVGVRRDIKNISPLNLWPKRKNGLTLKKAIGKLEPLNKMGDFSKENMLHFFRPYNKKMLPWIENLKEGESAFDNKEPLRRPHKIIDGNIVFHKNKMTNKYKRMYWDRISPCIHTRSDVLASQMTIHPRDNRVLSLLELKHLLNIPNTFKFIELGENFDENKALIKKNELNIRRILGESVPFNIFDDIAKNIKYYEQVNFELELINNNNINYKDIETFEGKSKFYELNNINKNNNGAFYTPQSVIFDLIDNMDIDYKKEKIKVIEPSVGTGNFIPQLVKKIGIDRLVLYVFDIDKNAIKTLKENILLFYPKLNIKFFNEDYVLWNQKNEKFDFVIGNPPFIKTKKINIFSYDEALNWKVKTQQKNIINYFFKKSFDVSNNVLFILPKYFFYSQEYKSSRMLLKEKGIINIFDYGISYFDVYVEIISIISGKKKKYILVNDVKNHEINTVYSEKVFENTILLPYRNENFDKVFNEINFNQFDFYRDRQITNQMLNEKKQGKWVIKSKNLDVNGGGVKRIIGYDKHSIQKNLMVEKYLSSDSYLIPNFTYNFRIYRKPKNTLTNGSILILIPKYNLPNLEYMNSDKYKDYFKIIMSNAKFTLNLNKDIIYLLGWKE